MKDLHELLREVGLVPGKSCPTLQTLETLKLLGGASPEPVFVTKTTDTSEAC